MSHVVVVVVVVVVETHFVFARGFSILVGLTVHLHQNLELRMELPLPTVEMDLALVSVRVVDFVDHYTVVMVVQRTAETESYSVIHFPQTVKKLRILGSEFGHYWAVETQHCRNLVKAVEIVRQGYRKACS